MSWSEDWKKLNVIEKSWTLLSSAKSNVVKRDASQFMVVIGDKLHTYNIRKNDWTTLSLENKKDWWCHGDQICYDLHSKILFISGSNSMEIIDLSSEQLLCNKYQIAGDYKLPHEMIFVDSVCHCIAYSEESRMTDTHQTWDDETKQWLDINTFSKELTEFDTMSKLIFLSKRKELLLFGSAMDSSNTRIDVLCNYSMAEQKWTHSVIKLPFHQKEIAAFGHVLTKDEQYIIIIGGYGFFVDTVDTIFILNLETMIFTESMVRCPFDVTYNAIMMESVTDNELLIHGYVKNEMEKYNICIPSALINIICDLHLIEYIHVINFEKYKEEHWKINVDEIFKCKRD